MEKEEREKLQKIIKRGKWDYVCRYGLPWGFFSFMLIILMEKFILEYEITSFDVAVDIVVWSIAGLIFGLVCWHYVNKKIK